MIDNKDSNDKVLRRKSFDRFDTLMLEKGGLAGRFNFSITCNKKKKVAAGKPCSKAFLQNLEQQGKRLERGWKRGLKEVGKRLEKGLKRG